MFYSSLFRRHLLDMHIEDWHPDFLTQFSPETYVDNLKKARINYDMVYLQSHVGLCYFPTKSGVIHKAFEKQPDLIRRVIELCHRNGIKVCGYYSLIYNTREHDRHPQWRMLEENGHSRRENRTAALKQSAARYRLSRYGFCCPNNPEYRKFVYSQIDEILAYFDCDALFFDMPFWPHTCYCRHCADAFGKPIPSENTRELVEYKARMMGDFVQSITDYVKQRRPDMPVEHNCASSLVSDEGANGCVEEVLEACDYVGGDLYGDLYNHSFACKFFKNATKNQPFEQMFSRCKPGLGMHTLTKSPDEMKTALASTMQHHGATLVIDAIDPVGTVDSRVYDRVGEVFRFQEKYEPYFTGEMVEEVGVYYGMRSRLTQDSQNSLTSCANAGKTLARAHIPFGVTGSFHGLRQYRIIVAPLLSAMEDGDNARLIDYVAKGGTLYLSGCGNAELVEALTGNAFQRMTEENKIYIAPQAGYESVFDGFNAKYPLPFEQAAPLVAPTRAEVIATIALPYTKPDDVRYAAIHSDPPDAPSEFPAVTVNAFGKGTVIWSALPIESMPYAQYRQIFLNLLHLNGKPDYFFSTEGPAKVEITAFKNANSITINAAVLDEEAVSTPVSPFFIKVRACAKSVKRLPRGENIPFKVENGYTVFKLRRLHIFDMYEITE